jgi:hypothetical protein
VFPSVKTLQNTRKKHPLYSILLNLYTKLRKFPHFSLIFHVKNALFPDFAHPAASQGILPPHKTKNSLLRSKSKEFFS